NRNVLDLCCGTGNLSEEFLGWNYHVTGLDLSPSMLEFAKHNNKTYIEEGSAEFIQGNIIEFSLQKQYGLVTCLFDSINHLENYEQLSGCFNSVHGVLSDNGYFVFDINTEMGLRNMWKGTHLVHRDDDTCVFTDSFFEEAVKRAYTIVYCFEKKTDEELFRGFKEVIYNTVFKVVEVAKLLDDAGFNIIRMTELKDFSVNVDKPESCNRIFFFTQKRVNKI
ncbi:MAG: class I SAM-dependent methyltransferase, partial [Candidatus Cloacimonetes bacterium]|nr:class I SAM-dependent methyltransferase [Candidatus Cloacimonadota bacterium]